MWGSNFVPIFRNQFLSTNTGYATSINSQAIAVQGNKAVLSALTLQTSGTVTLTYELQGSYDAGQVWKTIGNVTQNSFGHNTFSQTGVDYTHVRIVVTISGTTVSALFNTALAFSCQ